MKFLALFRRRKQRHQELDEEIRRVAQTRRSWPCLWDRA